MHICKHSVLDQFTLVNSVTYTWYILIFFFSNVMCDECVLMFVTFDFYINLYSDTVITDTCLYNDEEVLLAAFYTFIY